MSLELARSSAEVKTGYYHTDPPVHYFELSGRGRRVGVPMAEAVTAIEEVLDEVHQEDAAMDGLRRVIASMYPQRLEGRRKRQLGLVPSLSIQEALSRIRESDKPVNVLGVEVEREDFAHMVNYMMTNTSLQIEEQEGRDPRLALLDRIRGDA